MKQYIALIAALALGLPLAAWSQPESETPEVSLDGLELIEKSRHKAVYVAPGVDWSVYDAILIDEATVAFRKNWQRDQNRHSSKRISASDMDDMRARMATTFDKAFTKELIEKGAYELAEGPGDNVLRIRPHIMDLDVYAPDSRYAAGIQRSYTETAGRMMLKLELYDSATGDLLAVASDRREAPRKGYYQWANTVSNTAEFRRMLEDWAKELRKGLEDAKSG